jgi:hypothetical protein
MATPGRTPQSSRKAPDWASFEISEKKWLKIDVNIGKLL